MEETLCNVSDRAGVPTTTVRLGQVCGDKLGHWNEKEWFPALVKSSLFTRCLPGEMSEVGIHICFLRYYSEYVSNNLQIAFILSYPAGRAFVEMRKSSSPVLHLVHPRPIEPKAIMEPIATELGVALVPYSEWLSKLEESSEQESADEVDAMQRNPALQLLDFFRAQRGRGRSGLTPRLSTTEAEKAFKELIRMRELGSKDAKRWIAAWRASGFLPAAM